MSYSPLPPLGNTTASASLPVTLASDQADVKVTLDGETIAVASSALPTGASTSANQTTIIGHVDGIETVLGTIDADTSNISTKIDTIAGAVVGTEMQVDVLTMPIVAVTQSGTWDEVGINDSGNSITIDAPVGTPAFVRLSDGAAAITTLPVSLASVPSHAVTNAGTFAVQSTNQANSGVDIGDVTINNASGASAVNIQDGGNSITVDGTVAATQSGTWTVQPGNTQNTTEWLVIDKATTAGGLSKFHLVSAATTNATSVKASAGQVYAITAFNLNASPRYLKFHNTAGTPTAGSGVTDTYLIPGNTSGAGLVINFDKGIAFSTGIGVTLVTGITDADATGVAASEIVLQVYYK